jgi:hypothetical protein
VVFKAHENDILLTIAPGNRHTLAIKILDLSRAHHLLLRRIPG